MATLRNKLISTLLLAGFISSCSSNNTGKFDYKVWTDYSTNKVIQQTYRNDDFLNKGDKVVIKMMKDEYESSQLIITSNKKAYFDLIKTDLVDKTTNNILPKEKIEIYVQKYMTLTMIKHTSSSDGMYQSGDNVPDMLLPIEYAIKSGENYVEKNMNQGLSIEVDSYGLNAGKYEGNFTLKIGDKEKEIPIEVTVWDISFEGKSSIQSCWLIYSMYMFTGEYDASRNMINTYADFLSKYKANPYVIQNPEMNSPEAFMQDVERMWKIKNYNSIIIPYDFPLNYDVGSQGDVAANYIVKLAEKSTEEDFYLDYALFYPSTYDEADVNANKKAASPSFFERNGRYQQTLERAINILNNKGYFLNHDEEWNNRVKSAIRNIPDVFTNCNYIENWVSEYPVTFCPKFNVLDSQKNQEVYKDYAEKNANGNLWTYTCVDPNYPYPSHHLDDDCLSMRILGWMEKAYSINGYLYYMANMYTSENDASNYTTPYTIPDRNGGANGDGFVMYPGRLYGSSTPFPSMRLVTYRDGLEDYDMLEVYERKIKEICEKYHIEDFNFNDYVSDIYKELFSNAIPSEDHEALYNARNELAKRILELNSDDQYFYLVKKENDQRILHIYTNKNYASIDGKTFTGELIDEGAYHYQTILGNEKKNIEIKVGNSDRAYNYVNSGYQSIISSDIECSKSSTYEMSDGGLNASIISVVEETVNKTIRFIPHLTFKNVDLNNVNKIVLEYSNPSLSQDLFFDVDLVSNITTYTVGGHFCIKGGKKVLEIDLSKRSIDLSKIKDIRISFVNYYFDEDGELQVYQPRDIKISDIYLTY